MSEAGPAGPAEESPPPDPQFFHLPVLLQETLEELRLCEGMRVLDCTLGAGGHSLAILGRLHGTGLLTSLDVDAQAHAAAARRLGERPNWRAFRVNFGDIGDEPWPETLGPQDAILMDLGVSSPQLDVGERGFSIKRDGPLDMRMDARLERTAADVVNFSDAQELRRIFFNYGEEPRASRVAGELVKERGVRPFTTTGQLVETLERVLGRPRPGKTHPATRVFQALRIEVNDELANLRRGLDGAYRLLKVGGRLAVMSYHSLEDRIAKRFIADRSGVCRCVRGTPLCVCGAVETLRRVGSKALVASEAELERNPRARSARLRIAEKVG